MKTHKKKIFCSVFRMKRANSLNVLNVGARDSQDGSQVRRRRFNQFNSYDIHLLRAVNVPALILSHSVNLFGSVFLHSTM